MLITARKRVGLSQVALRRSLCREEYYEFVKTFWPVVIADDPVWNWHIRIVCSEIQKICERVFKKLPKKNDLVINVPPGTTKSTLCSVMLLPWIWTRMPTCRFLGGSYNADLSWDFGNKARRLIKSPLYQETFSGIEILSDQDTKGYFSNSQKGERFSTSTGASIIGRHFHVHVIDDPINPKGARSELDLRAVNTWLSESVAQRCVSLALTPSILVMQRLAVDDPSGVRLARVGGVPVRHLCLPAEISDMVNPPELANKYKNGLLEPVRLNRDILEERRVELGQYGYAGQFEQRPTPLTGGIFEVSKLVGPRVPPDPAKFKYVMRWWDKAATPGSGDYTVGLLMGMLEDIKSIPPPHFWVLDVIRKQLGSVDRENLILRTAHADSVKYKGKYKIGLEEEPGSAGKDSTAATIRNLAGFVVITERSTGTKVDRADAYATQVNGGNVAFAPGDWNKTYIDELQFFGEMAKYDDQVDASSGPFNFLSKRKWRAGAAGF